MDAAALQPHRDAPANRPVVDAVGEDAHAHAGDLADGERLRAELLDDADLEGQRVRPRGRDVLRADASTTSSLTA